MILTPALAVNLRDYNPEKLLGGKEWRITEKIDGVRRLFHKHQNGGVIAYSRSGIIDNNLPHITEWIERTNFPADRVYDCELVDKNFYSRRAESYILRTETISKANSKNSREKEDLIAICFDVIQPGGDVMNGERRDLELFQIFYGQPNKAPVIEIPRFGILNGNDSETLNMMMKKVKEKNGEGLMLMNMAARYTSGRSLDLVKVKRISEFIGTVVDVELAAEGTKIFGGISALVCNVDGCTTPVRVGTGFTNEERRYYAKNSPIGKRIEIESFSRTVDRAGNSSLSIPIFKGEK